MADAHAQEPTRGASAGASVAAKGGAIVKNPDDLDAESTHAVRDLCAVTALPDCDAWCVLTASKWDMDRASALIFRDKADEALRRIVGSRGEDDDMDDDAAAVECVICMEPFTVDTSATTPCGHVQCLDCLPQHVHAQVRDGGSATIECPMFRCTRRLPFDLVERCISDDPALQARHRKSLREEFVATHPNIKWCPGPDCPHAIALSSGAAVSKELGCTPVQCKWIRLQTVRVCGLRLRLRLRFESLGSRGHR
jgi:ariadne-1